MSGRTLRYILVGALALAIGIPSVAVGFGEGRSLLLGKRNPSPNASRAVTKETEIIASTGTYGTRQSNKRDGDGGGAIYGCRSDTGREPCIRANNLKGGRAFEFVTTGKEAGRIEVGDTDRRAVHHERDGHRHGPERRQGRRQGSGRPRQRGRPAQRAGERRRACSPAGAARPPRRLETAPDTYRVTFNRDVSQCTYSATPQGDATTQTLAVQGGSNPQNVRVDADAATPFQLLVIC